ncbi:MAG TPA: 2-oxo-4-hydroxy-4-carboxy-5-ureidoimidazoline decarboxylase [Synechococcales cyanobacterium M55_K2018_004]|nr:2-oxo-4-hydroxy-4-carboxy-5-ureidoimidazoline decarboxylase [Synechococcales cyanobacterium M55_K2018_004]
MPYSLSDLNQMNEAEFVAALGSIFEETPAIARQVWQQRPFPDVKTLHERMVAIVQGADRQVQQALILAHPDLGSRVKMAEDSVKEQAGAGLDRLSAEEYNRFLALNRAYREKFGFPFIIAVRNHTKDSILQAFEQRLHHSPEAEFQQALEEIYQIAWFRLQERAIA